MTTELRQVMANALREQGNALFALSERVDASFGQAVEMMLTCKGRVIISGMGKSGLIGKKIAATLASTGTISFFMHPGEAFHGDLGMVRSDEKADVIVLISYSGETDEVLKLIPSLKSFGTKIIAITGGMDSTLANHADVVLNASVKEEVCPNNLAPTTSTTVAIAIGDALAVALIKARNFQPRDFARFHPGGSLGRRLLTRVRDVMRTKRLPFVDRSMAVSDVLMTMTDTRTGFALVMDERGALEGVITDGDLRRYLLTHDNLKGVLAADLMTTSPVTVNPDTMLVDAEQLMRERQLKWVVALGDDGQVVGLLDWAE
ncbi:KpsF/GutQ family sugar-phosphate isomerase [Candidatus Sororendozoicomonas aggregata]|uniref:KpsF/GutQ family sugar-phosphate isomerase n=1 Tax=Candidatus Sororendozoicomonas aggregata TaxID=3073239 RepID=UPI002ECFDB27